ncbi:MAG: GNAT family N-acetyltransferase [Holophaga sp.]|jgi:ribosomal protein S18 acetylase RimI-like enzyme
MGSGSPSTQDRERFPRHPACRPFTVRPRLREDLPAIVELMRRVYPPPHPPEAAWSEAILREHLERFPEGQLVAADDAGRILGDSTGMRLPLGRALAPHTWSGITGRGRLDTHDPRGDAFYGVDIAVDVPFRGRGVASAIYAARFRVARNLGCRAFVAGARIPGYHLESRLSPERYVEEVVAGARDDPTLSRQLHLGFQVVGLLPGYFRDYECENYAVLILKDLEAA